MTTSHALPQALHDIYAVHITLDLIECLHRPPMPMRRSFSPESSSATRGSRADTGVVRQWFGRDDPPLETRFSTLFKKPYCFRFEFRSPHPFPPLRHIVCTHVVGSDGGEGHAQCHLTVCSRATRFGASRLIARLNGNVMRQSGLCEVWPRGGCADVSSRPRAAI
jgi:hypothetical protein